MIPPWIRLSVAGAASLLVGMAIGRFSYTLMMPALIEAGALTASQAGYGEACNLFGYPIGAVIGWRLASRWGEARLARLLAVRGRRRVSVIMIYSLAIATRHAGILG